MELQLDASLFTTSSFNVVDEQVFGKITCIKYKIVKQQILCCLKVNLFDKYYCTKLNVVFPQLELVDANGVLTGESFSLKYGDVEGVLDFLVLRQNYDSAIQRLQNTWKPGDRFRAIIIDNDDPKKGEMWFEGEFLERKPHYTDRPESNFECCRVK